MKYSTIIFDLFGTLVDSYSIIEFNALLESMASQLKVPKLEFFRGWVKAARESMIGKAASTEESVHWICQYMGITPSRAVIKKISRQRMDFEKKILMNPRQDALDVLKILKKNNYKIGLISDCTIEAPLLWNQCPLSGLIDKPVFSSKAKMKKPDPRIYQLALDQLAASAESTVYVGDGSSRELSGALKMGMYPVKIQQPQGDEVALYSMISENWEGKEICSFYELLPILEFSGYSPIRAALGLSKPIPQAHME